MPLLSALFHFTPANAGTLSITLRWTAPGDDGLSGRATRYDLRYSTQMLTASNFTSARVAPGLHLPQNPGAPEVYILAGVAAESTYYIAMKTVDDAGNWSTMSNVMVRNRQTVGVEDAPTEVGVANPFPNPAYRSVRFSLSMPAGAPVRIQAYDIAGRHIRSLEQESHGATASVTWDLQDKEGRRVAPGAYIIRVSAADKQWTRRVVVAD